MKAFVKKLNIDPKRLQDRLKNSETVERRLQNRADKIRGDLLPRLRNIFVNDIMRQYMDRRYRGESPYTYLYEFLSAELGIRPGDYHKFHNVVTEKVAEKFDVNVKRTNVKKGIVKDRVQIRFKPPGLSEYENITVGFDYPEGLPWASIILKYPNAKADEIITGYKILNTSRPIAQSRSELAIMIKSMSGPFYMFPKELRTKLAESENFVEDIFNSKYFEKGVIWAMRRSVENIVSGKQKSEILHNEEDPPFYW